VICLSGKCRVLVNDGEREHEVWLIQPQDCLVLEPKDWHILDNFTAETILLVVSNEYYDSADYIYEAYDTAKNTDHKNT
jgi:oxalate decarboxylase/phosphoglucose isomerase-like protein (cupin superfamily)